VSKRAVSYYGVQAQLQRVVGERGQVLPYRHRTDPEHRSVGWYVTPARPAKRCNCPYCTAARGRQDLYLGYNLNDALFEAELAARAHAREAGTPQAA
jgi:hypothetical protein